MSFQSADNGKANVINDRANCQSALVVFEARLRGLNITALRLNSDNKSISYRLGNDSSLAWINPKTGKQPTIIEVKGNDAYKQLLHHMEHPGRYSIGINTTKEGHVLMGFKTGKNEICFYDCQVNKFVDLSNIPNLESFELFKIDRLLFKADVIPGMSQILQDLH